jgi:hypothetical protein
MLSLLLLHVTKLEAGRTVLLHRRGKGLLYNVSTLCSAYNALPEMDHLDNAAAAIGCTAVCFGSNNIGIVGQHCMLQANVAVKYMQRRAGS